MLLRRTQERCKVKLILACGSTVNATTGQKARRCEGVVSGAAHAYSQSTGNAMEFHQQEEWFNIIWIG